MFINDLGDLKRSPFFHVGIGIGAFYKETYKVFENLIGLKVDGYASSGSFLPI
jgi:hypothetical protein